MVARYAESEDVLNAIGTNRAVALCNHHSDVDWVLGWLLAGHTGCLGGAKCLMKKSLSYVPVMGWSWYFLEYIFLARSWDKDRPHLVKAIRRLSDFPFPFWVRWATRWWHHGVAIAS